MSFASSKAPRSRLSFRFLVSSFLFERLSLVSCSFTEGSDHSVNDVFYILVYFAYSEVKKQVCFKPKN